MRRVTTLTRVQHSYTLRDRQLAAKEVDHRSLTIPLVEDDGGHAELVVRILEGRGAGVGIGHLSDDEVALEYLNDCDHSQSSSERVLPELILLDLRLPEGDGFKLLQHIKTSATLRQLSEVVLTTLDAVRDVRNAYDAHANGYVAKPDEFSWFAVP